jgi:uncharacterized membrane protein YGL010W
MLDARSYNSLFFAEVQISFTVPLSLFFSIFFCKQERNLGSAYATLAQRGEKQEEKSLNCIDVFC